MKLKNEKTPFNLHLFVCTNERSNKQSCGASGGKELRDSIKSELKHRLPGCDLRVNASGCLGFCDKGVVAIAYPSGVMWTGLRAKDAHELTNEVVRLIERDPA